MIVWGRHRIEGLKGGEDDSVGKTQERGVKGRRG